MFGPLGWISALALATLLAACSEPSGPRLRSVEHSPAQVEAGGTTAVWLDLSLDGPSEAWTAVVVRTTMPNGQVSETEVRPRKDGRAVTEWSIRTAFDFHTEQVGTHRIEVWLVDAEGKASNPIERVIEARPAPTALPSFSLARHQVARLGAGR